MKPEGNNRVRAEIAGVVLAGGRSLRMGGETKALLPLAGKPMLRHVIDRVRPQVIELSLSVEYPSHSFDPFGLPQLPDQKADGGPLQGLLAALQWMDPACDWMLLVPCDAPFVPGDLAPRLYESAVEAGLAGGAGTNVWALVTGFSTSNNYYAINVGQLKNLAKQRDLAVLFSTHR